MLPIARLSFVTHAVSPDLGIRGPAENAGMRPRPESVDSDSDSVTRLQWSEVFNVALSLSGY